MEFEYKDYLETQLNIIKAELGDTDETFLNLKIKVAYERSFKLPKESNTLLFVVKKISGSYVLGIKNQPVQIICYSEINTYYHAQQILELFTKLHQNEQFYENNILIKQNYDTPVVLRAFVPTETGYKASFYCYGNFVVCEHLSDIKNLQWFNSSTLQYEDVEYIDASFGYAAVLNTTKKTNVELSESVKQESGITLDINFMNNDSNLCKQINKIMFGELSGDTGFLLKFSLNSEVYQIRFVLETAGFNTDRVSAPGLSVHFKH